MKPTAAESRFRTKWVQVGQCHLWTGYVNRSGYGEFWRGPGLGHEEAHRVAWRMAHGVIAPGRWVLHSCDTPNCVNPEHLFLGDQAANMKDMADKGRSQRGVRHYAAKLTEEAVRHIRHVGGSSTQVATAMGVSARTVRAVRQGRRWAHVPDGAA